MFGRMRTLEHDYGAITQNTAVNWDVYVAPWLSNLEIAAMGIGLAAGTGQIDVTVSGSHDNANWNAIGNLMLNVLQDGAGDFATLDLGAPYPWLRFTATEDNTGTCTGFKLFVTLGAGTKDA